MAPAWALATAVLSTPPGAARGPRLRGGSAVSGRSAAVWWRARRCRGERGVVGGAVGGGEQRERQRGFGAAQEPALLSERLVEASGSALREAWNHTSKILSRLNVAMAGSWRRTFATRIVVCSRAFNGQTPALIHEGVFMY